MRLSLLPTLCGAVGIAFLGLAGVTTASAMPLAPVAAVESGNAVGSAELVQYRPGHFRNRVNRRELRHHRNRPAARFILKNKRRAR